MNAAFADTSFYAAVANPRDPFHAAATRVARRLRGRTFTTEYVLTELGNGLARSGDRPLFLKLLATLRSDPETTVVPGDHALFDLGVALFSRRMDKDWSLTDCISFVVMREKGITDALSADHHFEQAGFNVLLK